MSFARTKWGISIAGVVSVALLGCGRSQTAPGSTAGTGGSSGTNADAGSGPSDTGGVSTGGVTVDSAPATGARGGASGEAGATSMGQGGRNGTGGVTIAGGSSGSSGTMVTGGATGMGGRTGTGGTTALGTGGGPGTGGLGGGFFAIDGSTTGDATPSETGIMPMSCKTAMPSGGTLHTENSSQGTVGNLTWLFWENGSGGSMTSFSVPAFSASWGPNSGDVLARIGFDWGDSGKTYDQYGPITAQFAETKSGSGGGYSYIGVYGITINPCVEFYIVDDSYDAMPIKAYASSGLGSAKIDGETYTFWDSETAGTGDSACSKMGWHQYHSVRQTARSCGQISVTEHFKAWKAVGLSLGSLVELEVLVEVGGGTGSIDFPIANVLIE